MTATHLVDLWTEEKQIKNPFAALPVTVDGWPLSRALPPSRLTLEPRTNRARHQTPNKRRAVALPHPGQSYNPSDADHQVALQLAVQKLAKKQTAHDNFVGMLMLGRAGSSVVHAKYDGNLVDDKTWGDDEIIREKSTRCKKRQDKNGSGSTAQPVATKRDRKKKKKLTKTEVRVGIKRSLKHRRHPDRTVVEADVKHLDRMTSQVETDAKIVEDAAERRKVRNNLGQKIKTFGRYHFNPLVMDVASSKQLVGSLRHLGATNGSHHAALSCLKSLEERNLIPARMSHKFNVKKILKPKGEVVVKREPMGVMPQS